MTDFGSFATALAKVRNHLEAQISDLKIQSEKEIRALVQTEKRLTEMEKRAKTVRENSRIMVEDFNRVATALSTGRIAIDSDGDWQLPDLGDRVIDAGVREAMTPSIKKLLKRQHAINVEWRHTLALRSQLEEWLSNPELPDDLQFSGENLLVEATAPAF